MKYIYEKNSDVTSYFVREEYIPATVKLNESYNNKHIGFYYNDTDLIEFSVDTDDFSLNKAVLTFTNHYVFSDSKIDIHSKDNGTIKLLYPQRNSCSYFKATVYSDGISILTSENIAVKYVRSGQLILGVDNEDSIVSIDIVELDEDDIAFVKYELEQG